jgi:tetrapyrrole methylase family protein/MazG family protein
MSYKSGIDRLLNVVAKLRSEDGCTWDRKQTLDSLKKYLVEECYELIDAIDGGDSAEHLDELGDVLLQVALQAQIRREEKTFDFDDVANHLADKLVRRHPHVFGNVKVDSVDDVIRNWAAIKSEEKTEPDSIAEGIPRHLPALSRADKIQVRAARVGFDWDNEQDVLAKVQEELEEVQETLESGDIVHFEEELGDLLFSVVNLARFKKIDSEAALDKAIRKFSLRFDGVKQRIEASGRKMEECSLEELDAEWEAGKRRMKAEGGRMKAEG